VHARKSSGFTLVELMVVIAIVAILAVMAAPAYREMIDRMRVRSAADDVLSVLANARAGAVKAGLDTAVSATTGANWCVGATSADVPTGGNEAGNPTACTCSAASTCLVAGEQMAVPVGKHAGTSMRSGGGFTYDGKLGTVLTGGVVAAAATPIVLTSPRGTYDVRIGVTPLGQATLCTPSGKPAMAGIAAC
jgi:prepilin-type N-terminal cleavage/methylation domain-containing protein